jgi:predicted AAA+ superfamily ATPase
MARPRGKNARGRPRATQPGSAGRYELMVLQVGLVIPDFLQCHVRIYGMIPRRAVSRVRLLLSEFPAVALLGARQVGKTTLARALVQQDAKAHYLDLERPSHRARLAEPELYLSRHADQLVVLDEIQRVPALFPTLRALIDDDRRPGRFLLLGSAAPELLRQASETLAGRLATETLSGIGRIELPDTLLWRTHWWRGGFPDALLARSDLASRRWMAAFLDTFVERDLRLLGFDLPPEAMRRFLQMLAHHHGQIHNAQALARSLAVSGGTVARYRDLAVWTYLVRALPPFHRNLGKRLVKRPKLYLRDSGMLHALLRLSNADTLAGHPMLGLSFEGYILENIAQNLPEGLSLAFWRTHEGAELDIVLHDGHDARLVIEVKYSATPKLSSGFHVARRDLGDPPALVVVPADAGYPLAPKVDAVSLLEAIERIEGL